MSLAITMFVWRWEKNGWTGSGAQGTINMSAIHADAGLVGWQQGMADETKWVQAGSLRPLQQTHSSSSSCDDERALNKYDMGKREGFVFVLGLSENG